MGTLYIDRTNYSIYPPTSSSVLNGYALDTDDGLKIEMDNGISLGYRTPKFRLEFSDDFDQGQIDHYENFVKHFFLVNYYCGDWSNQGGVKIKVKKIIGSSTYSRNFKEIRMSEDSILGTEFMHELIHALMHRIGNIDGYHPHDGQDGQYTSPCAYLNIFDEGSPGLILDLKTRIEMNVKQNQFDFNLIEYDEVFLPIINEIYTNTIQFCHKSYQRIFGVLFRYNEHPDTSGNKMQRNPITQKEALKILGDKNLFAKKVQPFYEAKFRDEFNYLSKYKLLPKELNTFKKYRRYQYKSLLKSVKFSVNKYIKGLDKDIKSIKNLDKGG